MRWVIKKSQPVGLTIDETTTEVTDNWSLHGATYSIGSIPKISVFVGIPQTNGVATMLDKFSKNIMINRHPCILKYIASWKKGGKLHLATEQVQPLSQVLSSQTALQKCVGLQSILKALVFLHDYVQSSHNNVCRAAIYVTQGGSWKLGGLECLCKFNEMTSDYLSTTTLGRYDPAVSANESARVPQPPAAVDRFAFGVLASEVLSGHNLEDVPGLTDFLDICKKHLQNTDSTLRPSLSSLLEHPFFNHDFIAIYNFLVDLPIKSDLEKQDFFRDLTCKLDKFPEDIVASQLGSLLLSRMVLLDTTAQLHLLPQVFTPLNEENKSDRLFSESTFRTHIVPRLLPLFCVRDVHIRLILLSHFSSYCSLFSEIQLQNRILPELLVGIKDTNDVLVSSTLRALADLVPVLGSSVVIGGKRGKLFSDGKPKAVEHMTKNTSNIPQTINTGNITVSDSAMFLTERASPDGGEDLLPPVVSEEEETWPGWENSGHTGTNSVDEISQKFQKISVNSTADDISVLDVKISVNPVKSTPEFDFFQDMEPVISKPTIHHVEEKTVETKSSHSKFDLIESDIAHGWGEDLDVWEDLDSDTNVNAAVTIK
uniref:Protein kinase domain-containing protein n=1 Tax=Clastoptera arizonana TaxID=38151 RepID=A0A1B6DLW2_9HEMI